MISALPGASRTIASAFVAKAPPDGHILLITTPSFTIVPLQYKDLPFDTGKSFAPVSLAGIAPLILTSSNAFPAKTVKETPEDNSANAKDAKILADLIARIQKGEARNYHVADVVRILTDAQRVMATPPRALIMMATPILSLKTERTSLTSGTAAPGITTPSPIASATVRTGTSS